MLGSRWCFEFFKLNDKRFFVRSILCAPFVVLYTFTHVKIFDSIVCMFFSPIKVFVIRLICYTNIVTSAALNKYNTNSRSEGYLC